MPYNLKQYNERNRGRDAMIVARHRIGWKPRKIADDLSVDIRTVRRVIRKNPP